MKRAAIIGIGQTPMVRRSDESEWSLALAAACAAVEDAGVDPAGIDGIVRYSYDAVTEPMLVRSLGIRELSFYGEIGPGSLATCAVVGHAAMAIATGRASTVLVYRSVNQDAGIRYGRAERHLIEDGERDWLAPGDKAPGGAFAAPYGLLAPGQAYAMGARRYAYENGLSQGDLEATLGAIAVAHRRHANLNPAAMMRAKELDMEQYLASRILSSPLRRHDYCLESVGGAAAILVDAERARAMRPDPAVVLAVGQSMAPWSEPTPTYAESLTKLASAGAAHKLYEEAGIRPDDLAAAMLYDAFTPLVLLQIEAYGLAGPGQGWRHVLDQGIGPDSRVPVNTHGGLLSEGYIHGFNHITEAVRQIRGTAAAQTGRDGPVLVGGHMMSSLILGR